MLRVAIRSIVDGRYRFSRYFPFRGYNTPITLDELRAKLVGLIQAPATKIAGVLAAPAGQIARVINAHATKEQAA